MLLFASACDALCALVIAACSDGMGPTPEPPPVGPPGAIVQPFVVMDTITGFNGQGFGLRHDPSAYLLVNGSALVTVNGQPARPEDLHDGELALIRGTRSYRYGQLDSWHLDSIDVRHQLVGPVESIDLHNARVVVMGQQVNVTGDTIVADISVAMGGLAALQPEEAVVVSGHSTASGELVATRIARRTSGSDVLLHGLIATSDPASSRFRIGGLDVYYGQANVDRQDFPTGTPAIGDHVMVRATGAPMAALLEATVVTFVPRTLEAAQDADVELTGFVTRYGSAADFDVGGVATKLNCDGPNCGDDPRLLGNDAPVWVFGKLDESGVVGVNGITYLTDGDVSLTGPVTAIDSKTATLTVLGFRVQPNVLTRFGSERVGDAPVITTGDLRVGDVVAASGTYGGSPGLLLASKVLRVPDQEPLIATSNFGFARPAIVVLGQQVLTNGSTNIDVCGRPADDTWLFSYSVYFLKIGFSVPTVDPLEANWVTVYDENYC